MPQLEQSLTAVVFAGLAVAGLGWLWLLARAFRASVLWFIGVLVIPPLAALFLLRRPDRAGGPIALVLLGAMAVGGAFAANAVL